MSGSSSGHDPRRDADGVSVSFDLPPAALRELGERVLELALEALAAETGEPVLDLPSGPQLRARLDEPLPRQPGDVGEILERVRRHVLPHVRHNGHPRFFGYVCTSADPLGALADLLASSLNQPVTAWRSAPSATEVERLAVRWLDELTGFGGEGGLLVSGGSSANFHGLACAVARAGERAGLPAGGRRGLTAYVSREGHVSLVKALRLLGIPDDRVRRLDVDGRRRLRPGELRRALEHDVAAGLVPAVACASAGTANAGTIDPLPEIAGICRDHDLWLHVDGSYGAPAVLTADYRWMAETFAVADSMSLDPHKWLFVPVDAGCVLVRDEGDMRRAFSQAAEYTRVEQTDPIERHALFDHGLEMSRRFRGLKVWMILKARGADAIAAAIEHDIELRRHLDRRIDAEAELEAIASELSICCFRYRPPADVAGEVDLDQLNADIVRTLVGEGRCYMSPTTLDGRTCLRACIVSFRTRREDVDFFVDEVLRVGRERSRS